ncbi:tetraacyldisaccharide 4'-kinase [Flavobacteriaceae bacterium F89]|uniref:Tetraacyldisaccharide 4'-kinase n=1 Tax=Cerina litoralis TaxID=2874477 RepID=A0AAE3EYH0_9FLAO|nr:tetraacyldisaccharide 4'-kinase [Cerina litoralis]MCG2461916.1 tetraacyldisaccharide 4'-kinase [Cerina litoralis]
MEQIRKLGFPIAMVYGLVVRLRNYLYDIGIFKANTFETPTVCVGNLSVGGTGKTPMVEFLVSNLKETNKIAVLSRGYGRKSKGWVLAEPNTSVEELGDEPFQIFSKFPQITVAVDADRSHGIRILEDTVSPDLILLDDAFQHRRVIASFSILLTAYGSLYPDDQYLPVGNLRDHKNEARRADVIVVTKCPANLETMQQTKIKNRLKPNKNQLVLFSTLVYDPMVKGLEGQFPLTALKDKKVVLVTGIANPGPLLYFLAEAGIAVEHLPYGDHHFFTASEIELFNTKDLVLTTEKDYSRLQGRVGKLYFLGIKHQFLSDGKAVLLNSISTFTKPGR